MAGFTCVAGDLGDGETLLFTGARKIEAFKVMLQKIKTTHPQAVPCKPWAANVENLITQSPAESSSTTRQIKPITADPPPKCRQAGCVQLFFHFSF
jgi:hypothetical protein